MAKAKRTLHDTSLTQLFIKCCQMQGASWLLSQLNIVNIQCSAVLDIPSQLYIGYYEVPYL